MRLSPPGVNARFARDLIETLAASGMIEVCVSPGSRSTPLALAAATQPALRLHVIVDERSAAFFALGMARESGRPVALICTSGSAAAHYHPAVIEAFERGAGLIVLSADRPAHLQGIGAAQTTCQKELFGSHVQHFEHVEVSADGASDGETVARRAWKHASGADAAPVHINVAFDEPLAEEPVPTRSRHVESEPVGGVGAASTLPCLKGEGVVIAGDGTPEPDAVRAFARAVGAPVLADPLSGLRGYPETVSTYDAWLRSELVATRLRPGWIVRLGRAPTSKACNAWLSRHHDVMQLVVDPHGRRIDASRSATAFASGDVRGTLETLADGHQSRGSALAEEIEALSAAAVERVTASTAVWFEGAIVRTLLSSVPDDAVVFAASSMPIRDIDTFHVESRPIRILANRGVNGIDGQISTAAGIAMSHDGPTCALVGDLAVAHDLSALALLRQTDLKLVVVNNGGGGIFEYLPIAGATEHFERLFLTPQPLELRRAARALGVEAVTVTSPGQLRDGLAASGSRLIEAPVQRDESVRLHRELFADIAVASERLFSGERRQRITA